MSTNKPTKRGNESGDPSPRLTSSAKQSLTASLSPVNKSTHNTHGNQTVTVRR